MYRLHIDGKPTSIVVDSKLGAWDAVGSELWRRDYPDKKLPARCRAKFVLEEGVEFDSLLPKEKVRLLKSGDTAIFEKFHNQELCTRCGTKTVFGSRFMVPIDGRWGEGYFNLWRCKKCNLPATNT